MRLGVKMARGKPVRLVFDGIVKARFVPIAGFATSEPKTQGFSRFPTSEIRLPEL
jgi:hypothetical protein